MHKKNLIKALIILLLCGLNLNVIFGAIVSDNDGGAFVTKAEFESLKESFDLQIQTYNDSISTKIDGAIAAYLAGMAEPAVAQINLFEKHGKVKFGAYVDYSTSEMVKCTISGESVWANTCGGTDDDKGKNSFRLRRVMSEATNLNMDLENGNKGSTLYNGASGKYLYLKKDDRGYELSEYWSDYFINHCFTGSFSNSPNLGLTANCTWANITPFRNLTEFGTEYLTWGPNTGKTDQNYSYHNTFHISTVYKSYSSNKIDTYYSNTLPTTTRICILDTEENKILDYHQATVNVSNSTWGWVRAVGTNTTYMILPDTSKIKYYLKKPKTQSIVPAGNFIDTTMSDLAEKKVLLTDGAPFVVCSNEGKLSFNLKMSCDTTGKTVKFGFKKNETYGNNDSIDTNITDINLRPEDFNYNLDEQKTLKVEFDVMKNDIIYFKVDTSGLLYDSNKKTYFITPTITDLIIK